MLITTTSAGRAEDRSADISPVHRAGSPNRWPDSHARRLRRTVDAEIRANSRRRLAQEHITPNDAERALGVIDEALSTDGPLTRRQLASRIAAAGIRTEGQAAPHLLMLAALRGKVVLGPVTPQGRAFVLTNHWLAASPVELPEGHVRDRALAELARRYLVGHGPASPADLAAWSG